MNSKVTKKHILELMRTAYAVTMLDHGFQKQYIGKKFPILKHGVRRFELDRSESTPWSLHLEAFEVVDERTFKTFTKKNGDPHYYCGTYTIQTAEETPRFGTVCQHGHPMQIQRYSNLYEIQPDQTVIEHEGGANVEYEYTSCSEDCPDTYGDIESMAFEIVFNGVTCTCLATQFEHTAACGL